MSSSEGPARRYEVHDSAAIARAFFELQREATRQGRGAELLRATRAVYERLREAPLELGEPLYRLPALRMQVRCVSIRPLYLDYAVCDDRPLVFIRSVKLLGR